MPVLQVRTNDGKLVGEVDLDGWWIECNFAWAGLLAEEGAALGEAVSRAHLIERRGVDAVFEEEQSRRPEDTLGSYGGSQDPDLPARHYWEGESSAEPATRTLRQWWEMERMDARPDEVPSYRIPGHGSGWQFLEREDAGGRVLMVRWTNEGREERDFPADTRTHLEQEEPGG